MPDDNPATDNAQLHAAEVRRLLLDALNTVSKEHNSIYAAFNVGACSTGGVLNDLPRLPGTDEPAP